MPESAAGFRPWRAAWQEALYGAGGFYRRPEGPGGHFETSATGAGGVVERFAEALAVLAARHGCRQVVDIGAGRGELLTALASTLARSSTASSRSGDDEVGRTTTPVALTGVDVVARPPGLPAGIGWLESPGGSELPEALRDLEHTLVIAHEWLDVVPCEVLEVDGQGRLRLVEVDPTGAERLGPPPPADLDAWCTTWWPLTDPAPGVRVEVGLARDAAWAELVGRVRSGVLLAVDYGYRADDRPPLGTLAGHRAGRLVPPVPDGTCDLTAHVAWDSLLAASPATRQRRVSRDAPLPRWRADQDGAGDVGRPVGRPSGTSVLTSQRTALLDLGVDAARPALGGEPAAYLRGLQRAAAAATLLDAGGLGGLGWLLQEVATGQADPGTAMVAP